MGEEIELVLYLNFTQTATSHAEIILPSATFIIILYKSEHLVSCFQSCITENIDLIS